MVDKRQAYYKIWRIAWPAILSNISLPLLGLVDSAILGHLNSAQFLAAVAIGTSILTFLYWGFSFLRMGTTGLVAKAVGASGSDIGNSAQSQLFLFQSLLLSLVLGLLIIASHPLWTQIGLNLMSKEPNISALAGSYLQIRIFSAPAVLITYSLVGWFIGHQNTRWPMLVALLTNLLNIGLDFFFIIGLDMGSDGAAWATLIAEYCGCALAIWAALRHPAFTLPEQLGKKLTV